MNKRRLYEVKGYIKIMRLMLMVDVHAVKTGPSLSTSVRVPVTSHLWGHSLALALAIAFVGPGCPSLAAHFK